MAELTIELYSKIQTMTTYIKVRCGFKKRDSARGRVPFVSKADKDYLFSDELILEKTLLWRIHLLSILEFLQEGTRDSFIIAHPLEKTSA
jgi:hypothetical protein